MTGTRRVFPETSKREALGRLASGCISPAEAEPKAA